MANPPKANQAAQAESQSQPQPKASVAFSLGKEEKLKIARAIATRDRKWGADQAKAFLAIVLLKHGVPRENIESLCNDLDFNGAVINTSQFAQWADGTIKEPDRLNLGFALRASETRKASILASIEGL